MNCGQERERHETDLKNGVSSFRSSFSATSMANSPVGNAPADWIVKVIRTDPVGKTGKGAIGMGRTAQLLLSGRESIPPLALPTCAYRGNGFYSTSNSNRRNETGMTQRPGGRSGTASMGISSGGQEDGAAVSGSVPAWAGLGASPSCDRGGRAS